MEQNVNWIWVPDEEHDWLLAKIIETNTENHIIKVYLDENNFEERKVDKKNYYDTVDETSFAGVDDLLQLGDFNKQTLLHNTRLRFQKNEIYTFIGHSILIAVNPYKNLDIYNRENILFYKDYFNKINQDVSFLILLYYIFFTSYLLLINT
jgi:myosin heavy subunit